VGDAQGEGITMNKRNRILELVRDPARVNGAKQLFTMWWEHFGSELRAHPEWHVQLWRFQTAAIRKNAREFLDKIEGADHDDILLSSEFAVSHSRRLMIKVQAECRRKERQRLGRSMRQPCEPTA
jgi:hypothetical protein